VKSSPVSLEPARNLGKGKTLVFTQAELFWHLTYGLTATLWNLLARRITHFPSSIFDSPVTWLLGA